MPETKATAEAIIAISDKAQNELYRTDSTSRQGHGERFQSPELLVSVSVSARVGVFVGRDSLLILVDRLQFSQQQVLQ